jgi:hypothetical protein
MNLLWTWENATDVSETELRGFEEGRVSRRQDFVRAAVQQF